MGFEDTQRHGDPGRQGASGMFCADSGAKMRPAAKRESTFREGRDSKTQSPI